MKKRILLLLCIASVFSYIHAEQIIMTRESGVADLWTSFGTNGSTLNTNVDNPLNTGINTSLKCIQNTTSANNWYDRGKIWGSLITVDADNRYLHVMVYTPGTTAGKAMIVIKPNGDSGDKFNDYQGNTSTTSLRFDIPAGVWTDMVWDLQTRSIAEFSEIYFADQNWSGSTRNFYYDDIVLNDNPDPRTSSTNGNEGGGNEPFTGNLGDFESVGVIPSLSNNGGCASMNIADNPYNTCLNETGKVLSIVTSSSKLDGGDWWKGVEIDIQDIVVSAETQYLHILMNTDLPKFEWDCHTNEDVWSGSSSTHAVDNTWFDYVINLNAIKGSTNLNGKTITALRLSVSANDNGQQSKTVYIDEIVLNNSAAARVCNPVTGITTLQSEQSASVHYYNLQGVEVAHPAKGAVYLVRKIYENKVPETTKVFFK
jgi:hypothetical protein